MKTSLAVLTSLVVIAFATGCASHSDMHSGSGMHSKKAPTGAPAEQPVRSSGGGTGGTGGPR